MVSIDSRLIDADDEMKITEDFNRALALLDAKSKELSDRCTALEPAEEGENEPQQTEG